jgi:TRAP-type mannitol/chloroaromatic compound transport system permease large subunit
MMHIYKGIMPFVILQLIGLAILVAYSRPDHLAAGAVFRRLLIQRWH